MYHSRWHGQGSARCFAQRPFGGQGGDQNERIRRPLPPVNLGQRGVASSLGVLGMEVFETFFSRSVGFCRRRA